MTLTLIVLAGMMGASGIVLAAAAAHAAPGAGLDSAAYMLLLHATAVLSGVALLQLGLLLRPLMFVAARGPPPSAINGDDAAGDAFDKLRGVVRECKKGATGFDHDHFSKEKLPGRDMTSTPIPFYWPNGWSRTSREQPGTSPELQWLGGTRISVGRRPLGLRPRDLPIDPLFPFCSHGAVMGMDGWNGDNSHHPPR